MVVQAAGVHHPELDITLSCLVWPLDIGQGWWLAPESSELLQQRGTPDVVLQEHGLDEGRGGLDVAAERRRPAASAGAESERLVRMMALCPVPVCGQARARPGD